MVEMISFFENNHQSDIENHLCLQSSKIIASQINKKYGKIECKKINNFEH